MIAIRLMRSCYPGRREQAMAVKNACERPVILKSEIYNFHRLDLTRQAGFVVTIYDEDGIRLVATPPLPTPDEAFREARKIVDNKVEGPRRAQKGPC
jgi:hypothetical protein